MSQNPPINDIRAKPLRFAGRMMVWQAAAVLVTCLVAMFLTEALILDGTAVLVYFFGKDLKTGSRRAGRWSLGLMAGYGLIVLAGLVTSVVAPDRIQASGRPMSEAWIPWLQFYLVVVGAWIAAIIGLLIYGLREGNSEPDLVTHLRG